MKVSTILLAISLIASACKKDDVTRTKTDFLCDHTWILEEYSKSAGGNTTIFYKKGGSNNQYDFSKDSRNYTRDGSSTSVSAISGTGLGARGTWKLLNNDTQLQQQATYPTAGPVRTVDLSSLTDQEFVYTETNSDGVYKSRYIPQQ